MQTPEKDNMRKENYWVNLTHKHNCKIMALWGVMPIMKATKDTVLAPVTPARTSCLLLVYFSGKCWQEIFIDINPFAAVSQYS